MNWVKRVFWRLVLVLLTWVAVPAIVPAAAHPLDQGRQQVDFRYEAGQLTWTHALGLGPFLAQPFWATQLDISCDGVVSADEATAFAARFLTQMDLRLDGLHMMPTVTGVQVAPRVAFLAMPLGRK